MVERYAIFRLDQSILAIDISEVGPPPAICPAGGELNMVRVLRFHRWRNAEAFFATEGAKPEELNKAWVLVSKEMVAILTIA